MAELQRLPAFEKIGEKVLTELDRRLGDAVDASDLPGTLLMRLAEAYIKYLSKLAEAEEEGDTSYMNPLDAINQDGLPTEEKLRILTDYMDHLSEEHGKAEQLMATLNEEMVNGLQTVHE